MKNYESRVKNVLRDSSKRSYFFSYFVAYLICGNVDVVACLEVKPKARTLAEVSAQSQGQFSRHRALSPDHMTDAHRGDAEFGCQAILG